MKLSVVINTKNSADTLKKTLQSVKFADEIVVVDMHSTDETVDIARQFTENIFQHEDVGYVEPARNFAINKASHDWILLVDSDEVVSPALKNYIERILAAREQSDVYLIPRKNIIFGQKLNYSGWWPDYQPRLFKKDHINWPDRIHQHPALEGEVQKVPPQESLAIIHYNYDDVSSYLQRFDRYTSIQAENESQGYVQRVNPPAMINSFFKEFCKRFFVFEAYKDNVVGTSLSFLQSIYQLVVQLKIWELQQEPENTEATSQTISALETSRRYLNYWLADWHVKNSVGLKKIYWRVRRKLKI